MRVLYYAGDNQHRPTIVIATEAPPQGYWHEPGQEARFLPASRVAPEAAEVM